MKIVILGSTGMLGSAVRQHMEAEYGKENVLCSTRSITNDSFFFDASNLLSMPFYLRDNLPEADYIINCIGVIKPYMTKDIATAIFLNAIFPHALENHCKQMNVKLIHISTDCVYSGGSIGDYIETDLHDALDEYGKSKSLGEVTRDAMTIRTSIIGEELDHNVSLVEWVKSQEGKEFNGYTNHLWNGVTTKQYAKICQQIIEEDLWSPGLFHVFSDTVNKYELVSMIAHKFFERPAAIKAVEGPSACDRTMETMNDLNSKLNIPSIAEQIEEM